MLVQDRSALENATSVTYLLGLEINEQRYSLARLEAKEDYYRTTYHSHCLPRSWAIIRRVSVWC